MHTAKQQLFCRSSKAHKLLHKLRYTSFCTFSEILYRMRKQNKITSKHKNTADCIGSAVFFISDKNKIYPFRQKLLLYLRFYLCGEALHLSAPIHPCQEDIYYTCLPISLHILVIPRHRIFVSLMFCCRDDLFSIHPNEHIHLQQVCPFRLSFLHLP